MKDEVNFNSANESFLSQTEDLQKFNLKNFKIASKKKPSKSQLKNLIFAFNVCRYVKSNAIVLASQGNSGYWLWTALAGLIAVKLQLIK